MEKYGVFVNLDHIIRNYQTQHVFNFDLEWGTIKYDNTVSGFVP